MDIINGRNKRGEYLRRYNNRWGYLFIAPQVLGMLGFMAAPILCSFYLCFVNWDFINPAQWVGMDNFHTVMKDPIFWQSMYNTVYLVIAVVPLTIGIALLLAVCANRPLKGLGAIKASLFLPMVTSTVAISMVWYWLYAPDYGMINIVLYEVLGIQGPGWLTTTEWSKPAVAIMAIWQGFGHTFIILLAGLKGIPKDYYEAAEVDGAGEIRKFFSITFPMLSPVLFFVMVTKILGAFGIFNEVYMITSGGPTNSSYTAMLYLYNYAFRFRRMGEAAVVALVLAAVQIGVSALQFWLSRKWVNYNA